MADYSRKLTKLKVREQEAIQRGATPRELLDLRYGIRMLEDKITFADALQSACADELYKIKCA